MPARSAVDQLPDDIREQLNARLVKKSFSDYVGLSEWLAENGYSISKSALQRHGVKFEERLDALRRSTEMAKTLATTVEDDEGAMNDALTRLMQEKAFALVLEMDVDPSKVNFNSLGKTIAELSRASVTQKKWAMEAREKLNAAKEKIKQIGKRNGVSTKALREIESELNLF